MEYNSHFQSFGEDDVLSFGETSMCKIGRFRNELSQAINSGEIADLVIARVQQSGIQGLYIHAGARQTRNKLWMTEGKKCEVLKVGACN
jgi:hypothetical protein